MCSKSAIWTCIIPKYFSRLRWNSALRQNLQNLEFDIDSMWSLVPIGAEKLTEIGYVKCVRGFIGVALGRAQYRYGYTLTDIVVQLSALWMTRPHFAEGVQARPWQFPRIPTMVRIMLAATYSFRLTRLVLKDYPPFASSQRIHVSSTRRNRHAIVKWPLT